MTERPRRKPAAAPDLPKAPSTGHPARLPKHTGDPEYPEDTSTPTEDVEQERSRDQRKQHDTPQTKGEERVSVTAEELPMPPAKQRDVRQTWGTKLRPSTIDRLNAFASDHNTHIQDVVEMALDEFMSRRGG